MAIVAHTIYSHYDPQQREKLEYETGQNEEHVQEQWKTNTPHRFGHAPRFVPATIVYNEWGSESGVSQSVGGVETILPLGDLAGWYRSLTGRKPDHGVSPTDTTVRQTIPRKPEKYNRNNWFIMDVLKSEPSCVSEISPPTLADILARDPPPLPTEDKYSPPVWLTLGPSNKGFAMLQQSGWNEGEPLGPDVVRRGKVTHVAPEVLFGPKTEGQFTILREEILVPIGTSGEITEVRRVDIIDLTLSDSDESCQSPASDTPEAIVTNPDASVEVPMSSLPSRDNERISAYSQKALLTPIATVLKSDRLGVGLKAKTVGPFKASQKRVTHNAAALAAHTKNAEKQRKMKAEVGRGRRGFEKVKRREEMKRKEMLAYLKE